MQSYSEQTRTTPGRRAVIPGSHTESILLAFLGTAGLFYVNIMPAIVDGLMTGAGFTASQAGYVGSANTYGAAVGALLAVWTVRRMEWRTLAHALLGGLIAIDLLSMLVDTPMLMIAIRAVHGTVGGLLVGVAFSVIARTGVADRTYGYLLLVQFGLGGFGVMLIPQLVPVFGVSVLFTALILFSLATWIMTFFINDYSLADVLAAKPGEGNGIQKGPLILTLAALFFFQAANMGLYAYIIGLGRFKGLSMGLISPTLGAAAWVGIIGAGLVIVFSTRYGRYLPLMLGMVVTLAGNAALYRSDLVPVFIAANCLVGISWAFVIPYLLGMCAEFDRAGQMAAMGGFASKMGLASGPALAGLIFEAGADRYNLLIVITVIMVGLSTVACISPARWLDRRGINASRKAG